MDGVSINTVIQMAEAIGTFFWSFLGQMVTTVSFVLIPAALLIIRAAVKNGKSLLFYSRGRRRS